MTDRFDRLINVDADVVFTAWRAVAEWAGHDASGELLRELWIECEKGNFHLRPVVSNNPEVFYVPKSLIWDRTIYLMCTVKNGDVNLSGWTFGSTIKAKPGGSVSLSRDDIRFAFARRSLRPIRDLEKVMIGPAEGPGDARP